MRDTFRKLRDLLDVSERRRAFVVFVLMVITALLETIGVASIMPFMRVAADQGSVESNKYLSSIYGYFGFTSPQDFLFALGIAVLVLLVGSLAFKAFSFWVQVRFAHRRNHTIGCRVLSLYLGQPYEWFLNRRTSDISTTLLAEVSKVVHGALFPLMQVVSQGLVAASLLILLIVVDPWLAATVMLVLGGAYTTIFLLARKYIRRMGVERRQANHERFLAIQEAFGGIKDVKVMGLEGVFLRRFRGPSWRLANREAAGKVAAEIPSFAMQALVFGGIMILILYLMRIHNGIQGALPMLAGYAFAGYRLMPALQALYHQLAELRFGAPALEALHADMSALPVVTSLGEGVTDRIALRREVRLRDVTYSYPNVDRRALDSVDIAVDACTTVGLVGTTGSGKTTVVDVVLGLLQPAEGALEVDGKPITSREDVRKWQRSLGYVPQTIYLADDTVAANIAFGVPAEEIDHGRVEEAARIANLHDFVVNEMPMGYATEVGERGVRLSGGQRQRIGIARALYRDPDVLILDEATSALDNLTEHAVMGAIHALGHKKTIIVIAHRLTTVEKCDRIYMLDHGQVVGAGTYDELVDQNERFRAMAIAGQS